jgi:cyanophycinase-like exopeptidase
VAARASAKAKTSAPLYLLAGGRGAVRKRGTDPLLASAIQLSGTSRPVIAYVGAASGDNAAFRVFIGRMLTSAGAGKVVLAPLCGKRADPARAAAVISAADVIFISGGDVEEGMRVLEEKGMMPVLRKAYKAGKPFFGVSAGSIMLAKSWVRWADPKDDSSAEIFPCMGFAPVLCDTHGEDDGWGELQAMLALCPTGTTGYGIVSGTALVVDPDGGVAARGGEVHFFKKRASGVVQVASLQ